MRLSEQQKGIIEKLVSPAFRQLQWELWLFGSRVNDELKGGDVDLCIIADESPTELMQKQLWLRPQLEESLDLPVDLIMQSKQRANKVVTLEAIKAGVRLV